MACRLAVVKLGGSAITDKSSPETVRWGVLDSVAFQLSSYLSSGGSLALVHGGGSFGHYAVSRLRSERGHLGPLEVAEVQREMLLLSVAVINALASKGVPATLHPAHTICSEEGCDLRPIAEGLRSGLVPVTNGDAVLRGGEGTIISGDDLAAIISNYVGADCLIFVTDVDGVIGPDGNILKEVGPGTSIGRLKDKGVDVTGGMETKIRAAASSRASIVRIVGWSSLLSALRGEDVGTRVLHWAQTSSNLLGIPGVHQQPSPGTSRP